MSAQKKRNFQIEAFKHRVVVDPKYAEKTWKILEHAIHEIYNHNASGLSFEELYRLLPLLLLFISLLYYTMLRFQLSPSVLYSSCCSQITSSVVPMCFRELLVLLHLRALASKRGKVATYLLPFVLCTWAR
ncbi:Cullin-3 [Cucumis melo var. makuwa]|uniref:Cullin-3 n=1 Tax=Cucumis melo var. makuwa TaxID=1194695 RepID=A0A5D3DQV3_CUCMM|nr:Cullin-3 [Cucumis melo var. makuwa]TYK25650.1 Cullin-3 [Cucumis melo var. makuwa]